MPAVLLAVGFAFVAIAAPAGAAVPVTFGSVWSYLDDGSDQGTAWTAPGFDDSSWASGPAELGYGEGDEATVVSFGGNPSNKHITTYFRRSFDIVDPSILVSASVTLLRDDGGVVYLNGTEIMRRNLPGGTISYTTTAQVAGEEVTDSESVPTSLLVAGTNVLAVEIHQAGPTSSDISFDLEFSVDDTLPNLLRGPYLQNGSSSSVTLRWRTDVASDSRVRWGPAPGNLAAIITIPGSRTEHEVVVTGLAPNTLYYYSVGTSLGEMAGNDLDHRFETAPTTGATDPVRVWVLGDSGTANSNARAVRDAYIGYPGSGATDVWLMLGDNAYSIGTDTQYQNAVFDTYPTILRNTILWSAFGNHDAGSANSGSQTGPYYEIFNHPTLGEAGGLMTGTEAYYSFDHGNIHFISLDSQGTSRSPTGAMAQWLAADIAATNQDWIVAFWHHPPYSKGSHNSDTEGQLIDMRANFLPILEAGGVDLVLTGHSHSYERSVLLDGHYGNSGSLNVPTMVLDGGDGDPAGDGAYQKLVTGPSPNLGAVYAVAGSSGQISGGSLDHPVMIVNLNVLGSMVLDVDNNQLTGVFLDSTGSVRDTFVIQKPLLGAPECGDGVDNDADGATDFPADVGCEDAAGELEDPKCQDGIDNDGDGGMDFDGGAAAGQSPGAFPADGDCGTAWRNRESPGNCGLGFELALLLPLIQATRRRRR